MRGEHKRVVIVDTSNEIAGDGDIPHPAIGRARRMQVSEPTLQHEVMIEAVENHMPEVIVIDEIGRELEAVAARTIAERGVQLIGTAHGNTLENLLMNPTLCDLVGGIESVTLSDEEARRRGTQKSVLERARPAHLRRADRDQGPPAHGDPPRCGGGRRCHSARPPADAGGAPVLETTRARCRSSATRRRRRPYQTEFGGRPRKRPTCREPEEPRAPVGRARATAAIYEPDDEPEPSSRRGATWSASTPMGSVRTGCARRPAALKVPIQIVDNLNAADAVMTIKNYYRQQPAPILEAERRNIPIYILRSNTVTQMEQCLVDIFHIPSDPVDVFDEAMRETQEGIQRVLNGCERRHRVEPAVGDHSQPAASTGAGGQPDQPQLWARAVPAGAHLSQVNLA